MKKLILLVSIVIFILIPLSSCSSSETTPPLETAPVTPNNEETTALEALTPIHTTAQPTAGKMPTTTTIALPTAGSANTGSGTENVMVSDKDGMVQILVPAGEFEMGAEGTSEDETPVHTVFLDTFVIDQTEVTQGMFAVFVTDTGYQTDAEKEGWGWVYPGSDNWEQVDGVTWRLPQGPADEANTDQDDHPAVMVSWNDAAAYCDWAGRRLPTEAEWEKAARGADGRVYPWGSQDPEDTMLNMADSNLVVSWADAELDDGYTFTAPAGSYPQGASPYGALDMSGNVWEWTADWYGEDYYESSSASNPTGPSSGEFRVLRGGGWSSNTIGARSAYRNAFMPDYRDDNNGFRCAAVYVEPAPVKTAPPTRIPVAVITQIRTALPAVPLTAPTVQAIAPHGTMASEADGMILVNVPAGEFVMGSRDHGSDSEQQPAHTVYLDSFWIDATEVTNAMFAAFLNEMGNQNEGGSDWLNQHPRKSDTQVHETGGLWLVDSGYDSYPIMDVSWYAAKAYCEWARRRLPTEAEWEKAARGTDERIYPWGNEFDCSLGNFDDQVTMPSSTFVNPGGENCDGYEMTSPVGAFPGGASPYGVLDMAGNVSEWIADYYDKAYYGISPGSNPQGPVSGKFFVLRGGAWTDVFDHATAVNRIYSNPDRTVYHYGFRCALSP